MTDLVSQLVAQLEDMRGKVIELCQTYGNALPHGSLERTDAALTAAKAGGWLPIETAPKDGTRFIAWRKYSTRPLIARYWKDFGWFEDEDGLHLYNLTHWQPLPNPPKEQNT